MCPYPPILVGRLGSLEDLDIAGQVSERPGCGGDIEHRIAARGEHGTEPGKIAEAIWLFPHVVDLPCARDGCSDALLPGPT